MKIILSRKGFDSGSGGIASPILPDGTLLSLPIPTNSRHAVKYEDLIISNLNKNYVDLIKDLNPKFRKNYCHLDPDIRTEIREMPANWKPAFGQVDSSQSHLKNQGVGAGDLFLFFGWFRKVQKDENGKLQYEKNSKDLHVIFGYLQVGKVLHTENSNDRMIVENDFSYHPHARYLYKRDNKKKFVTKNGEKIFSNNTLYVATDNLIIDGVDTGLPGAGTLKLPKNFDFDNDLILTDCNFDKRTYWKVSDWMNESKWNDTYRISYHFKENFKEQDGRRYFESVCRGQEFVVPESKDVTDWALKLIMNSEKD